MHACLCTHLIKRSKKVLKGSLRPGRAPGIVCLVHSETALIPTGRLRTLVQNMAAEVNFLRQIGNEHTFRVMRHMIIHSLQEVPGLRSYMNTSYTYVLKIFLICVCVYTCVQMPMEDRQVRSLEHWSRQLALPDLSTRNQIPVFWESSE